MSKILGPDGQPARQVESRQPRAKSWSDVYEAANRRDFRGWFYLPQGLNPVDQLPQMSREAITERIVWLYKNVGAATMLIDRLAAAEAGTGLWPKWVTGNAEYDAAATDAYHWANHDPRVFSADGQNDAYSVQYAIRRCIALYGDCFGQLLRPLEGSTFPQLHLIGGWQCGGKGEGENWTDGVQTNALGRPLIYRFQAGTKDQTPFFVPADDVLHFHDPFLPGERRGVSCLAAVAKKMFRREDIGQALANGTLARERLGFAIEVPEGEEGGPELLGDGSGEVETVTNPDGSKYTVQKLFGERARDEIEIPELRGGRKLTTVESNRPGTAVMEFQRSILEEAAYARKYPPEYVFFLAGLGQGTVGRMVMVAAAEQIYLAREFQLRPQFAIRWPVFFVWQLVKSGYFGQVKVPANWWKTKLVFPALPTVDVGREGRLYDDRLVTGKISPETYHGMQGEDAADVEDEVIATRQRRETKLDRINQVRAGAGKPPLTYADLWPASANTATALAAAEAANNSQTA